jgi:hypothetical protein
MGKLMWVCNRLIVLRGGLEHTDAGVLSQRQSRLVVGRILVLMIEPVFLQGIDDLGHVRPAEGRALDGVGLASPLVLITTVESTGAGN